MEDWNSEKIILRKILKQRENCSSVLFILNASITSGQIVLHWPNSTVWYLASALLRVINESKVERKCKKIFDYLALSGSFYMFKSRTFIEHWFSFFINVKEIKNFLEKNCFLVSNSYRKLNHKSENKQKIDGNDDFFFENNELISQTTKLDRMNFAERLV